jgi:hypothetical protein
MQLVNRTPFPADLFRTVIDQTRIGAALLARITFDVRNGVLTPSGEQIWRVSGPPWDSPYGQMDSDEVLYKGGVDLFIFGHARAPAQRPIKQMDVRICVGNWSRVVRVIGDRVWLPAGKKLEPSAATPFVEMPLTLAHAYGGKDEWDELMVSYPDNEHGKGFYIEEEHAKGKPLPNLENPDAPIRAWTERPVPVGLGACPITSSQRLRNGIQLDPEGRITKIHPKFFNSAFPEMILSEAGVGTVVRIDGVLSEGPFWFSVPDAAPRIRLTFGDEVAEFPLRIDQIGVETDHARVFIAYRYPFRYTIIPLQPRSCELLPHAASAASSEVTTS